MGDAALLTIFFLVSTVLVGLVRGQSATTLPPPGQPLRDGNVGGFEIVGESLVSAQQVSIHCD